MKEPRRHIGVGIDTARYGHHVTFLDPQKQRIAEPLDVAESASGYSQLRKQLEKLHRKHPQAVFHVRIDAAGQYATNLEQFVRDLPLPMSVTVGEPKRNKDYHRAHSPKRKSDQTESHAMARYAVVEQPTATPGKPTPFIVLRRIASRLQSQVRHTTRLTNQLHETLSAVFPELAVIVPDIRAQWVLHLLRKYPTPKKIAAARSLAKLPYLSETRAAQLQTAARASVGSLSDRYVEELVQNQVEEIFHSRQTEKRWEKLMVEAFDALPEGGHRQLATIQGIGTKTAAAIVATAVSIDRFETDSKLIGFYGVFPEERSSGVDKHGVPIPPGKKWMSRQGNDLVRGLLWNCAKSASTEHGGNPAVRALFLRKVAEGTRKDVALGYCMTKLLRQVFGVWVSNRPFDPGHEKKAKAAKAEATKNQIPGMNDHTPAPKSASGCKEHCSERKAVTEAAISLARVGGGGNQDLAASAYVDFAELRAEVAFEQVLDHLGVMPTLRRSAANAAQYRGPCPIHGVASSRSRTFSVNLAKQLFQCFHPECQAQGNVLDFWAAYRRIPIYEAAVDLLQTFTSQTNSEQRRGTRNPNTPMKTK